MIENNHATPCGMDVTATTNILIDISGDAMDSSHLFHYDALGFHDRTPALRLDDRGGPPSVLGAVRAQGRADGAGAHDRLRLRPRRHAAAARPDELPARPSRH